MELPKMKEDERDVTLHRFLWMRVLAAISLIGSSLGCNTSILSVSGVGCSLVVKRAESNFLSARRRVAHQSKYAHLLQNSTKSWNVTKVFLF